MLRRGTLPPTWCGVSGRVSGLEARALEVPSTQRRLEPTARVAAGVRGLAPPLHQLVNPVHRCLSAQMAMLVPLNLVSPLVGLLELAVAAPAVVDDVVLRALELPDRLYR